MKELVKIFTVTKNETDLIGDFVKYHGSMFGYTNVILIDNDSTCPIVLESYKTFRSMGVTIETHSSYRGTNQGEAFTKSMLNHKNECKFLVGLDTDKFIQFPDFLSMDPGKTSMPYLRSRFRAYFSSLTRTKDSKFNVVSCFNSVPNPDDPRYSDQKVDRPATDIVNFRQVSARPKKCFFRAETFLSTVNGCHKGRVSKGGEALSEICYVHFHDTGARRSIERARNIVCGYGYAEVDSPLQSQLMQLSEVSSPIGSHRVLEYALFLSRALTLEGLVQRGLWPKNPNCLEIMAKRFPSIHGFLPEEGMVCNMPHDWVDKFDHTIFHDKPLSGDVQSSTLIQRLVQDPVQNPSVAVMLSGHLRNFEKKGLFWKYFVAEFPEVDIFVHTWTDGGLRGDKEWIDVGKNNPDHEAAKSILKPVGMVVENHESMFNEFSFRQPSVDLYYTNFPGIQTTKDFTKCIGSQLYSIKKCFQLTQSSEKKYDVYVRLRGDSIIENFRNLVRNSIHVPDNTVIFNGSDNHVHPGGGRGCRKCDVEFGSGRRKHGPHSNDVCDIFYYGGFVAMSKLCNMFDSVKSLVRGFQESNKKLSQKSTVKKYLQTFGCVTTVRSPHVYENIIKCFYPERLIREFMADFWLLSDTLGLVPKIRL